MRTVYTTKTQSGTKKLAANLAKKAWSLAPGRKALTLALSGNLGSGKTTFVQGFANALGIKKPPKSPTFILLQAFPPGIKNQELGIKNLVHIDAYRIEKPKELLHLGLKEVLNDPHNIVLIEWAEKIKKLLPKNATWIYFKHAGKNNRLIIFNNADLKFKKILKS